MNNMNKRYILIDIKNLFLSLHICVCSCSIPVTWIILVLQVTVMSVRAAVELDHLHNLSVKIGSKHHCAVIVC